MENGQQSRDRTSAALLLHPSDNVAVCRRDVGQGEMLYIEGRPVTVRSDITLGHKIAREAIPAGSAVVKYGMSIGISTSDIQPGDWVHLHNMKSDYIPSHTRQSGSGR